MDQPIYQSNLLLNPNDMKIEYTNITPQSTDVLGVWNSRDTNARAFVVNQENCDETKIVHGWNTAPRMEDGPCERTNITSLNRVHLNLNSTPVDEAQPFPHSLNLTCVSQSVEQNVPSGPQADNAGANLCPFIPNFFEIEHAPCSNSIVSSSNGIGRVSEDDGRARNSIGNQLLACKRKNMDGVVENLQQVSPSFSSIRGVFPEWCTASSLLRNPETSRRNLRARINVSLQHDASSSQPHFVVGSNRLSTEHFPGEPSSVLNQPHILPVSVLPHHAHHSPSSSSSPAFLQRRMRLIAAHEETSNRGLPIDGHPNRNISNSSLRMSGNRDGGVSGVLPSPGFMMEPCEMVPLQYHRNLAEIVHSSLFPAVGSESGHQCSTVPSRRSTHSSSTQEPGHSPRAVNEGHFQPYPRTATAIDRQHGLSSTSLSARSRDRRSRIISEIRSALDLMRRGVNLRFESLSIYNLLVSFTTYTLLLKSGSGHPYNNVSTLLLGIMGYLREDESQRLVSCIGVEVCYWLQGLTEWAGTTAERRKKAGSNNNDDIFLHGQSGLYGRHGVNDRHRDMRLDVDNMSYEELLALEERIGYVSTGLCEQAILKCLKNQRYSTCKLEVASGEQEPCSICQEDYSEGEDIGTLDCRHDFHTACIKQWLMIKNLCPICKTTALVEDHSTISSEGTK
ncbi:hypothetical protein KSP40_PGU019631 [Platanthera guangdongensis]|uniref:RING-type E3 ubiquitin transferase n=1 Tax=Platanthera guangdongensis TaxID=2320717 RepID=A0ABR2MRQ3_9ASPA